MTSSNYRVNERTLPWILFLAGCAVFIPNLDFESTGDTVYYANIIDNLRFDQLTAHQGYYLLGYACKQLFAAAFGLRTDQVLALMSALFGAAALSVGYRLLKLYLGSVRDALLGAFMLLLCHRYFVNATSAEVYIVQAFFIWTSYLLFEQRRFYTAGVSFALAMWVSPLTAAFGLLFPAVAWIRGYGIRSLVKLGIPVLLVYLPFLFFFYEELLWGVRGLAEQDEARDIRLVLAAQDIFKFQIKHYSFLNLLFMPALFMLRREKQLLSITLAAALPNIYVISQLRGEDNVFILTLDVFIVCWFVIGWRFLRERALSLVAMALLASHVCIFLFAERPFFRDSHGDYADEMKTFGGIVQNAANAVVFMDWDRRMAFTYYNRDRAAYPLEQGRWYDMSFDTSLLTLNQFNDVVADPNVFAGYSTVFVIEAWKYSPQASLFLDEETLNQRYDQLSERRDVERFLDVECAPVLAGLNTLYRCR